MFRILRREELNFSTVLMEIEAPKIAKKAMPGQFVIIKNGKEGERIPLTIAGYDREKGSVTVIFQAVGNSTKKIAQLKKDEYITDFVGPLGRASELDSYKKVCVIGGGLGCAIAYPQAKYLFENGATVYIIAGFRNKESVILEKEMMGCGELYVYTDDGSCGKKGFVTEGLEMLIANNQKFDLVIAIGPVAMMKAVSDITRKHNIKTIVSMNPIMIDGTGMCGGCRISVNKETKFACVDGPDFDGHEVDFDNLLLRNRMYRHEECKNCNLLKEVEDNA
ncbi:MAG: sulfide/dihydroorotate dehydrogenase-like FAD/NAD-binding protein [Ruminococcaceae bacterium]|nr:sulfide/dihydroorotate dehydrogenase-like FAD/NAD-binding protein [Oscillospiraceae bacterium]